MIQHQSGILRHNTILFYFNIFYLKENQVLKRLQKQKVQDNSNTVVKHAQTKTFDKLSESMTLVLVQSTVSD